MPLFKWSAGVNLGLFVFSLQLVGEENKSLAVLGKALLVG